MVTDHLIEPFFTTPKLLDCLSSMGMCLVLLTLLQFNKAQKTISAMVRSVALGTSFVASYVVLLFFSIRKRLLSLQILLKMNSQTLLAVTAIIKIIAMMISSNASCKLFEFSDIDEVDITVNSISVFNLLTSLEMRET